MPTSTPAVLHVQHFTLARPLRCSQVLALDAFSKKVKDDVFNIMGRNTTSTGSPAKGPLTPPDTASNGRAGAPVVVWVHDGAERPATIRARAASLGDAPAGYSRPQVRVPGNVSVAAEAELLPPLPTTPAWATPAVQQVAPDVQQQHHHHILHILQQHRHEHQL